MTNNDTESRTTLDHFNKEVLVVPARHGWPLYKKYGIHAYICQEGRAFKPVKYIAFYEGKQIHPVIPLILEVHDHVAIARGKHVGRLGEVLDRYLVLVERPDWPYQASVGKVFLLSAPDAAETVKLAQPVINDQKSKNGTDTPYVMCQRYISLEALRRAKKTSDLCDK
jgi:hypothetical protein